MGKEVNAEVCPNCNKAGGPGRVKPHPDQPGIFGCELCGTALVRIRRNSIFGDRYTYVEPTADRPGVQVYHGDEGLNPREEE